MSIYIWNMYYKKPRAPVTEDYFYSIKVKTMHINQTNRNVILYIINTQTIF